MAEAQNNQCCCLREKWQNTHRGRLHDASSWSIQNVQPSLTYASTGAGFTGAVQMNRFINLFPSTHHPLALGQLTRYNNEYHVISCSIDEQRRSVTEELVISALHDHRLDYLMPCMEPTNLTYVLSIVTNTTLSIFPVSHCRC